MFRKLLIFACFLSLLSTFAFAVSEKVVEAQAIATVNFGGGPHSFIGFSSTQVNGRNPEPTTIDTVSFHLEKDGERKTNTFYIYWKIFTTERINVYVSGLTDSANGSGVSIPVSSTNAINNSQLKSPIREESQYI